MIKKVSEKRVSAKKESEKKKIRETPKKRVFQLKVELLDTNPLVWRRLMVAEDVSLWELHIILQIVMGWKNAHLMQFHVRGSCFAHPSLNRPGDDELEDAHNMMLREAFPRQGSRIIYEYDFGDSWAHQIVLEKAIEMDKAQYKNPFCVEGENAGPPEDCGGVYGFEELKRIIADPEDKEYEEMSDWLYSYYSNYDPSKFSLSAVNRILNQGSAKYSKRYDDL